MRVSSPRNPCLNAFRFSRLLLSLTVLGSTAGAADNGSILVETKYKIDFESRLAYHTFSPADLASARQILEAEQKSTFNRKWSLMFGARAYVDGAFATNETRYNSPVRRNESFDVIPKNIYGEYREGPLRFRAGNQEVVWGEAFGAYYADIVNPKDMRESALGDVASWRLPVPMINTQLIFGDASLQLIYIPKPYFNKMPSLGNDFVLPYQSMFGGAQLNLNDNRTIPLTLDNGEVGVRAATLVAGFDLALFFFTYHDRFPNYGMSVTNFAPMSVTLDGMHPRIQSYGFTGSKAIDSLVIRWEYLYTQNRLFDAVQSGALINPPSDEFTGVLGTDYNGFENCRLGLQFSKIHRTKDIPGAIWKKDRNLVNAHMNLTLWKGPVADVIFNYVPDDGSTLSELRLTVPVSHQFDFTLGSDIFLGGTSSQFGTFRSGSRAFVQLHAYFGG